MNCYINGVLGDTGNVGSGYLQDLQTHYTVLFGGQYTGASTFGTFYTGFIYSIKIWNEFIDLSTTQDGQSGCTGTCSYCPLTGICIRNCGID